jgi:lipid A 3-O-deacylase
MIKLIAKTWILLATACLLTSSTYATGIQFGLTLPVIVKGKDPKGVHGYHAVAWYQPESLIWPSLEVYFRLGYGHWWAHGAETNRSLNIFAVAPVVRYFFTKSTYIDPYAEASIGLSYLSRTHFDDRNLGMHFAFQDELGLGAVLGKEKRLTIGLSALHYSNGSLCAMNAGITMPLMLNVGYKFA